MRTWFWLGAVAIGACGGKAVVDGAPGAGGSGGTSAGGHGATTTTNGTVTVGTTGTTVGTTVGTTTGVTSTSVSTVGAGGAGGSSPCGAACKALTTCAATQGCEQGCLSVKPPCQKDHDAWLNCLLMGGFGSVPTCPQVPACQSLAGSYAMCAGCAFGSCGVGSDGSCGCDAKCQGQAYSTQCIPSGGQLVCLCLVNGMQVGKCISSPNVKSACDITSSCCAPVFFVDG